MKVPAGAIFMAIATVLMPADSRAEIDPGIDASWGLCAEYTARAERHHSIPRHLLGAIALAESGRWDDLSRENIAWPWTVMAEGRGRYLDSKAKAIAEVQSLQRRGISNIDVGCMQINLHHHGDAFPDLNTAFNPAANTDYAARFLVQLRGTDGSWNRAASHYHSRTPDRARAYGQKVAGIWKSLNTTKASPPAEERALTNDNLDDVAALSAAERFTTQKSKWLPVDYNRTAMLNARLKSMRAASRLNVDATSQRRKLVAWGNSQAQSLNSIHAEAMAEAQQRLAPATQALEQKTGATIDAFAARRQAQLKAWRRDPNTWRRASAPVSEETLR
jgi:hypothetical protein